MARKQLAISAGVVIAVALGFVAVGALTGNPPSKETATQQQADAAPTDPLGKLIYAAQTSLKSNPNQADVWADLAISYVAEAKATVDPSYYPKAEGAVAKSLAIDTKTNFQGYAALAGLRAAEHQFTEALAAARKGLAINAYSSTLYGAEGDAYTQLGRYADASRAIDKMNQLLPGIPAFTRASYVFELRGDIPGARAALERALQDATDPGDIAFARDYLGELDLNYGGNAAAALQQYEAGLAADPTDFANREGKAKALAALGRTKEALADYAALVSAVPQPQYVTEYGELLQSIHDPNADRQYALFRTEEDLFRANKVVLDTEPTLFEADHGSPAKALQYAKTGWATRPFLEMADAYSWAEYVNHDYPAALGWSNKSLATGWTNALFHFHRGMIEKALGQRAAAIADLTKALQLNPHFNPLQVPVAKAALASLRV